MLSSFIGSCILPVDSEDTAGTLSTTLELKLNSGGGLSFGLSNEVGGGEKTACEALLASSEVKNSHPELPPSPVFAEPEPLNSLGLPNTKLEVSIDFKFLAAEGLLSMGGTSVGAFLSGAAISVVPLLCTSSSCSKES